MEKIPAKYQCHIQVFSEEASKQFPEPCIWDHAIELKPKASSSIPRKVYQLTQDKQKVLLEFVQEQLAKGYICPIKESLCGTILLYKEKR